MSSKTMSEVLQIDKTSIRLPKWMDSNFLNSPLDAYQTTRKVIEPRTKRRVMKATEKLAKKHIEAMHILKSSDIVEKSHEESE